jgi:uncharacterized protein YggT (Ycf19 family)
MAAVFGCLLLAPALPWLVTQLNARIETALAVAPIAACGIWSVHLRKSALPWAASLPCAALLAACCTFSFLHHPEHGPREWLSAFGCGIFVYAILSVLRMREKERSLQAIASAALVLSIGMIAKPAVLVIGILLSAISYFDDRRQTGSLGKLFLLLFTPLMLCLSFVMVLSLLYFGNLTGLGWIAPTGSTQSQLSVPIAIHDLWPLGMGLAVLLGRAVAGKAGRSDMGYLFLVLVLPLLSTVRQIPDPVTGLDFAVMLVAGAAYLIALDAPSTKLARFAVLAGLGAGFWSSLQP